MAKVISVFYVCVGLILDILCCKWRWLARFIYHLELLHMCLYYMVPNEADQKSDNYFLFLPFFYSICFFCDVKSGLTTLVVTMLAGNIFLRNIMVKEELNQRVYRFLVNAFFLVILLLIMASAVTYVTNLHKKLRQQVNQYYNLINRMREGVLLLSKDASGAIIIKFCNTTAYGILKSGNDDKEGLQSDDLNKHRFHPSRFRKENDGNGENTHAETHFNQTLSIKQIVEEAEFKE